MFDAAATTRERGKEGKEGERRRSQIVNRSVGLSVGLPVCTYLLRRKSEQRESIDEASQFFSTPLLSLFASLPPLPHPHPLIPPSPLSSPPHSLARPFSAPERECEPACG